jgi:hypothetical protein
MQFGTHQDQESNINKTISVTSICGEIIYTFPSTLSEYKMIEYLWYCPTLFFLFDFEDFFSILTAVLLERSIIFVSDNLGILSATILGFKTMIKPFSWCYALVPVLPAPLLGILDTP